MPELPSTTLGALFLSVTYPSTSALDAENKAAVMGALRKLMAGRTCVLISHDMDMVRSADHIVVLDEGSVQAEGNCDQVIKNSAYFAECCSAACQ